ncbi:MAG: hypothetical protein V3W18_13605 [candidate division Zixibacteria bacterium]
MTLIGIVGGVELALLFVCGMIGYIIYAVGREKSQQGDTLASDSDNRTEIQ